MATTPTQIIAASATLSGLAADTADPEHIVAVVDGLTPGAARALALYAVLTIRHTDAHPPVLSLTKTITDEVQQANASTIERTAA